MECPNCTFQNTPGLKACVRCRGLLDFSAVAIEPPRASHGRLTRRVRAVGRFAGRQIGHAATEAAQAVRIPLRARVTWSDVRWSVIPGLAQIRRGSRALGWVLLSAWAGVLIWAAADIGSGWSTFLSLSAISIHCLAISLLLNGVLVGLPLPNRAAFGMFIYVAVVVIIYAPAYLTLRSIVRVLDVDNFHSGPVVAEGDTLLYTAPWTRPRAFDRGDLVVYDIDAARTGAAVIAPGLGLERILGVPGDEIEFDRNGLWVNGVEQPPELWPLGGLKRLPKMTLTAGPGEYVIVPAALRWTAHGNVEALVGQMMGRISHVPDDHIRGRVFWRARPWSRAGVPVQEPVS